MVRSSLPGTVPVLRKLRPARLMGWPVRKVKVPLSAVRAPTLSTVPVKSAPPPPLSVALAPVMS